MKLLTKKDYDNYMRVVNQNIEETERRMETLDMTRKVSQLSFEDWVKFQNGELKIKQSGGGMVDAHKLGDKAALIEFVNYNAQ